MKQEILALVVGDTPPASTDGAFETIAAGGYVAVFVPATPIWIRGAALKRRRLQGAPKRQRWLEALMKRGTVLPFAPGTILDPGDAKAMVAANAPELAALVKRLAGRVQYQISVSWAEDRVLGHFRTAPEIARLFTASPVSGPTVARAVSRLSERLAATVAAQLADVSGEYVDLPREAEMLSNCVILLESDSEGALDQALGRIDAIWPDGFRIRQVGPGPAISFATLRLQRRGMSEIEQAHAVLGLPHPTTEAAVRDARQRLLRGPDADIDAIRAAARLLEAVHRVGGSEDAVHLVDVWSEGHSARPGLEQVA